MGQDAVWLGLSRAASWLCAFAAVLLAAPAVSAAATGVVYGGRTSQGYPVVIELKNRRVVAQALMGFDARCTAGGLYSDWDRWTNLKMTRKGKFGARFGPETFRSDDGTTWDMQSEISGGLNRARSKISGSWHFKITYFDSAGGVTDTCDSGKIRWTAKQ